MVHKAVCIVKGDNPAIVGVVRFQQDAEGKPTKIVGEIKGLAPGQHGFHVHEWGDFSKGCASAGSHYNPFGQKHGGPKDEIRHVGDLGNITAGSDGVAKFEIVDSMINLAGRHTVIGRMMVVDEKVDDFQKGGNEESFKNAGGARVGCGLIALANPR